MEKKRLRKFRPLIFGLVLAAATGLLVFTELVTMYANNADDFWFDFSVMIGPTLLLAAIVMLIMLAIMSTLAVISKKKRKMSVYYILFVATSVGFVCCYVHANFLAGMLPPLDGAEFDWGGTAPNLVSVLVALVAFVGVIFLIKKYKPEKAAGILNYTNFVVIAMMLVGLVSTMVTTDMFRPKKEAATASAENLNLLSEKENFLILMVDAVDARTFEEVVLAREEEKTTLKDFSFFKDSLGGYPFTRDAVPLIFSGMWNENKKSFTTYSTEAFENAPIFKALDEANYGRRNFYDMDFIWEGEGVKQFENMVSSTGIKVDTDMFLKQEVKYILFKTLPYPLKRFSSIQSMNYYLARKEEESGFFVWQDDSFYNGTLEKEAEKTTEKNFAYIHLEGAHVPFDLDENVSAVENGTYKQKVGATLGVIRKYLDYLKENGAYENATIVILADHGYAGDESTEGRQNPLLLVKGKGETHSKMKTSLKQVSYADLAMTLAELMGGKKSTEIFEDIPEEGRERRYMYYEFYKKGRFLEQTLNGRAWETEKMVFTGEEFNL